MNLRTYLRRESNDMTEQDKQNFINAFGFEKASEIINETMTGQQQKALDALAEASKKITDESKHLSRNFDEFHGSMKQMVIEEIILSSVEKLMEEHGYEMRKGIGNCVFKSSGIKYDEGKTDFSLLIPEFIKGFADVMTLGAQKYSAWNYLGLDRERVISAHHRHMNAYQRGELNDPETGLSHLFHATCCLQMLWALDNDFFGKEEKKCQT